MVNMYAGCRRSVFISMPYRHDKIISQCRSVNRELLDTGLEKKKLKLKLPVLEKLHAWTVITTEFVPTGVITSVPVL